MSKEETFEDKLGDNIKWWRKSMRWSVDSKDWSGALACECYLKGLLWCRKTLRGSADPKECEDR